jgi:hypothetical protein
MAEIRINTTGGLKLYDADNSHYAQIVAGTITSNVDAITLGHDTVTIADNLSLGSDSAILKLGADGDVTLTHDGTTGLTIAATPISIDATGELHLNSTTGDIKLQDGGTDQIAFDLDGTAGEVIMKPAVDSDDLVISQYDGTEVIRIEDNASLGLVGNKLSIANSSSDVVIKPLTDAKDIIFQQYDGTEVARIEDNATFNVSSAGKFAYAGTAVTATAAELNILDGVTSTAAELNIVDGNTSATSTTIADADRVVLNDNGTMVQAAVTDLKTYIGGGTLVKTGQTTLGSNADALTVDNCFTSDYGNYFVIMEDITNTVDSQTLRMALRTGGGSGSTDTGNQYRYASRYFQDDANLDSNTGVDQGQFTIATNSEEDASWKGFCGTFTFYQPQENTSTRYTGDGSFIQNDKTNMVASYLAGHYDSDAQHTGLTLYYGSGGIRAGANVVVYGISEA